MKGTYGAFCNGNYQLQGENEIPDDTLNKIKEVLFESALHAFRAKLSIGYRKSVEDEKHCVTFRIDEIPIEHFFSLNVCLYTILLALNLEPQKHYSGLTLIHECV